MFLTKYLGKVLHNCCLTLKLRAFKLSAFKLWAFKLWAFKLWVFKLWAFSFWAFKLCSFKLSNIQSLFLQALSLEALSLQAFSLQALSLQLSASIAFSFNCFQALAYQFKKHDNYGFELVIKVQENCGFTTRWHSSFQIIPNSGKNRFWDSPFVVFIRFIFPLCS